MKRLKQDETAPTDSSSEVQQIDGISITGETAQNSQAEAGESVRK